MHILAAAIAGLIFGTGLVLAGLVNPAVVLGFLDIFGDWNPALIFAMGGALAVALPGYRNVLARKPVFASDHVLPARRDLDAPLLAGAALFGLGWGLAGICPGPAVTMLTIAPQQALTFLAAMAVGMAGYRLARRHLDSLPRLQPRPGTADG